jgi:hypothetical protein
MKDGYQLREKGFDVHQCDLIKNKQIKRPFKTPDPWFFNRFMTGISTL